MVLYSCCDLFNYLLASCVCNMYFLKIIFFSENILLVIDTFSTPRFSYVQDRKKFIP